MSKQKEDWLEAAKKMLGEKLTDTPTAETLTVQYQASTAFALISIAESLEAISNQEKPRSSEGPDARP